MSEGGVEYVGEVEFVVPLVFLAAYAALLLFLRFLSSFVWSDDSGFLYTLVSIASTAVSGCAIFTLGYISYRYLMPSGRKKRALGASARVGRQQAAAVLAAMTENDPKQLNQEDNLVSLIDEVTAKLQGLEMAFTHLSPAVTEETKKRIVQFITYLHSIHSPWAEEEKQKSSEEKARLLALLCDTDPFATIKKEKGMKNEAEDTQTEEEIQPQSSAEAQTKENEEEKETRRAEEPQTPEEETQSSSESRETAEEVTSTLDTAEDVEVSSSAAGQLSALLTGTNDGEFSASALGFDLSGLEDYAETVKDQTEAEGEDEAEPTHNSAADDLMAALTGGATESAAPYEFGSAFAGLTDWGALTKSLGVSSESTGEGDGDKRPEGGSPAVEEEDDEWAALEEEYVGVKTADSGASSAKADLLGALGSLEGLGGGGGGGEEGSSFSLGDVDLSALSAFATTTESSFDTSGVDLSALDGLYPTDGTSPGAQENPGDPCDLVNASEESSDAEAGGKGLSYDDFFSAIQCKKEETPVVSSPVTEASAGQLIRAFGSKDDMNLSGMKRSKKKAVRWGPAGKGKPVYQMEDTHYAAYPFNGSEEAALFGVFDGHVGKHAAEKAKVLFPEEFAKNLRGHEEDTDMALVLRKTFLSTDARMIEFDMEGATATGVYIWKAAGRRFLQAANVGDSTAFLCRDGKAVWLSVDHKVNDPEERDRLIKAGMQLSEGQSRINGLAVSRALGDHFVKEHYPVTAEPFVSDPFELGDGDDKLIVASDGLWDIVSGQEALEIVKDMTDPAAMAAKLTETAVKSRLCNDNVTVIVVLL